jgi:hypothetical protein
MLVAESDGRSGGLVLLWNNDINVTSKEVEQNFIDIRINEHGEAGWRFTGFYGEPSSDRKHLSWDYIRSLHAEFDLPWIMVGDFNEILYSNEKKGVLPDHYDVCKHSEMFLMNVSWKIWALRGIFSLGEEGRSGKGWTVRFVILDGRICSLV